MSHKVTNMELIIFFVVIISVGWLTWTFISSPIKSTGYILKILAFAILGFSVLSGLLVLAFTDLM